VPAGTDGSGSAIKKSGSEKRGLYQCKQINHQSPVIKAELFMGGRYGPTSAMLMTMSVVVFMVGLDLFVNQAADFRDQVKKALEA
jgi:hypothetical protein